MPRGRNSTTTNDNVQIENLVQQSSNYKQFKMMGNNRDVVDGHVKAIKKAFEEIGNLTQVQPILVNERYEIIDGQHRFMAAKEMGAPIYFTLRPGLTVGDARSMNILHRSWGMMDFALSYATSGDLNYIKFLKLKEEYGFGLTTTMEYINGGSSHGAFAAFRKGEFVIDDPVTARIRLNQLYEVLQLVPQVKNDRNFSRAFFKVSTTSAYDHRRMLRKLSIVGDSVIRKFGVQGEYLRSLEEAYNHGNHTENRVRLY